MDYLRTAIEFATSCCSNQASARSVRLRIKRLYILCFGLALCLSSNYSLPITLIFRFLDSKISSNLEIIINI